MIGKTLSHYRIVEKIGAGGMGEVWRAEDTRLGRSVAVKVLPADVADDPDRLARFEHEARAVAALSHPNTLAIHDFGTDGGLTFAVMEYLEGETLRDELRRRGPLPPAEVRDRAAQIARGLAAAHEKGILHRDLKPENLFVSRDGRLKILDFGLAKVLPHTGPSAPDDATVAAPSTRTEPGVILGTVAYMSPEQVRGEPVDARSDLFSLGTVLFEMLTGGNPFRRPSAPETMTAILRDDPLPLAGGTPPELAELVRRCLARDPRERPPSAQEIARQLDAAARPAVAAAPREPTGSDAVDSLAVLPFRNESADEDADFLSDGITEMLIDNLSQLPRLKVMARSTVFRHGADADPVEVASSLKVRAVLTGRLLRRGDQIVVNAELVDAGDGRRLWGERFRRPVADLLAIEEEISREISDKLRLRLSGEEKERLARRPTGNAEAHEQYLRGRHVWNRWKTPEGMKMAIGFFERALELDPLHARAFAGLADSWSVLGNVKALPPREAYSAAKTAAEQGLAIDDSLAELHASLGMIRRHWDWHWDGAEASFRRAVELNPGYAVAHRWYAGLLAGLGRREESIAEAERAHELDPLNLLIHTTVGDMYFYARRYEESMEWYRKALELDPQLLPGHTDLARALELAGRYEEAIAEYEAGAALAPKGPPEPSSGLAHVYAAMGRREEALEIVRQLTQLSKKRYVSPYGLGSIHAVLGDNATALDWLEKAYAEHDQTLVWVKVHPRLDGLRDEPRYRELLRKMGLD